MRGTDTQAPPHTSDFARVHPVVLGVALLLALSTTLVAQGPRLFSREWYAQFSGAYSQPIEPFRTSVTSITSAR